MLNWGVIENEKLLSSLEEDNPLKGRDYIPCSPSILSPPDWQQIRLFISNLSLPSTTATGADPWILGEGGVGEALDSVVGLDSEGDTGATETDDPTGGSWEETGTAAVDLGERGE